MKGINASRRAFLRTASALSTVGTAGAGIALNLAAVGSAAAQSAPADYKAIVCLFLFGGCDYANTVLSYDEPSWSGYLAARNVQPDPISLALPSAPVAGRTILPVAHVNASGLNTGRQFALHPNLGPLKTLYDAGQAAVIGNVGPLIQPTTRTQYATRNFPLPPKLFSHNDQQSTWMAFAPEGASNGWGGRLGDLFMASNQYPVFTGISTSGNTVFLSGRDSVQYQIGGSTAAGINGLNSVYNVGGANVALNALLQETRQNLFEREQVKVSTRSIAARDAINNAIGTAPAFTAPFPGTGIGNQLQTVARIIAGRDFIGARRQVFFVSMGGFDHHDGLNAGHGALMTQLGAAVAAFQAATTQLGIADKVTLFTGSDFGRTLTSNGDGSDHGWGSHHFVVGGAVRGGDFYGRFPLIGVGNDDEVGQGRLLPGVAVDQLAGTLGRWFGVSDTDLLTLMPNLKNFGSGTTATQQIDSALARVAFMN
jgi:uncharacterized protein (DUF1501 family)